MPRLEIPALLLLILPAALLYARVLRPPGRRPLETALHLTLLSLAVLALAGPFLDTATQAVDLVIVADRSRSMPPEAAARMRELIELAEKQRAPGMRLGIVSMGRQAHVEQLPEGQAKFPGFAKAVDPDASTLADAIETAVNLVGPDRAGKILLFTDGLATGRTPLGAASLAASRRIAVDYRLFDRPRVNDVAIERIAVPAEADAGTSFQGSVWIRADRDTPVTYRCFRDDLPIAEGKMTVAAGSRPFHFRDRLPREGGLHRYRFEIQVPDDPTPENNVARAVLRAHDAPRLLLVTTHEGEDNFARALRAAGMAVDILPPARMPKDNADLDRYRAVILEDVSANEIGAAALRALRAFVEEAGGGLLVTGGRASFGVGGYFKSDLDPVLPVSMEMRQEHRKFRMAMAVALDRSGSMAAGVAGGLQKMDLANRGTVEAIKMLTPMDEVAVIAVDSSPHTVVSLRNVDHPEEITKKVLGIQSMGGGIFIYEALVAAGKALEKSTAATRHVVLFADAADSEEPGNYKELTEKYLRAGITVSVIGLGTEKDVDAELLKDIARRGNGRIFFTDRPEDLPRLFAQETLSVARSSFVDEPVGATWRPDAHLLGEIGRIALPRIGGYNLTYARPEAAVGAVTEDEYKAPILAFWHRGVGRAAAFTPEVDGPTSGPLLQWEDYGRLASALGRWLLGQEEPQGVSVTQKVEEPDARVIVEFDPASEAGRDIAGKPPLLHLITTAEEGARAPVPFQWTGERTLEARFSMEREGIYLPVVRLPGGRMIKAPPAMLPYSPEFLPRRRLAQTGPELLEEIAGRTGGHRRESLENIFEVERTLVREPQSLRMPLAVAILVLLLLEVAARRLHLWELAPLARMEERLAGLFKARPEATPPRAPAAPPPPKEAVPPPVVPQPGISSAFDQAKEKARRRLR